MITQTIHVMDCELLEYYFDVTAVDNPDWARWSRRSWIEGLHASDEVINDFTRLQAAAEIATGNAAGLKDLLDPRAAASASAAGLR